MLNIQIEYYFLYAGIRQLTDEAAIFFNLKAL